MQTVNVQQLRDDTAGVISAAQVADVLVVDEGRVVAVVTKPRTNADFEAYWQAREKLLAEVTVDSSWDSTQAISEDRDRA
jgi:hypothetical protein